MDTQKLHEINDMRNGSRRLEDVECTWRSMDGAATVSVLTWLLVFLPFKVTTDGLLAVVISQKLRFFAVGAGE